MWWTTAAPFIACAAVLVMCFIGLWEPWYLDVQGATHLHETFATPFALARTRWGTRLEDAA